MIYMRQILKFKAHQYRMLRQTVDVCLRDLKKHGSGRHMALLSHTRQALVESHEQAGTQPIQLPPIGGPQICSTNLQVLSGVPSQIYNEQHRNCWRHWVGTGQVGQPQLSPSKLGTAQTCLVTNPTHKQTAQILHQSFLCDTRENNSRNASEVL